MKTYQKRYGKFYFSHYHKHTLLKNFPRLNLLQYVTRSHVVDPQYPGTVDDIINLGAFWETSALIEKRANIIDLTCRYKACFENAYRYLAAAKKFRDDTTSIILGAVHYERLHKLTQRIIRKELKKNTDKEGTLKKRFLSGITPYGIYSQFTALQAQNYKIYQLNDEYHIASDMLREISRTAIQYGQTVYACYCPFSPDTDIEHLILPELNLAFVTSNSYHPYSGTVFRTINLNRYLEPEIIRLRRSRIRFNKKVLDSILENAICGLYEAKRLHDKLEDCYTPHMHFQDINALTKNLLAQINQMS
jgi:hypothetical protein